MPNKIGDKECRMTSCKNCVINNECLISIIDIKFCDTLFDILDKLYAFNYINDKLFDKYKKELNKEDV